MKQKARKMSRWKVGILSGLAAMMFVVFACSEDKTDPNIDSSSIEKSIDEDGDKEVFKKVEQLPEFEGGWDNFYKYIMNEIRYPLEARNAGVEGKVFLQFVVEKSGAISNVEVLKGIGYGCEEEAVRVLSNAPDFIPGQQRGKKVRVQLVVPVTFQLNHEKKNPDNSTQGNVIIGKAETNQGELNVRGTYKDGYFDGTVLSPEGDVLAGVNIVIAGTNEGRVSDVDGTFKIKVEPSQELVFSFVGYQTSKFRIP